MAGDIQIVSMNCRGLGDKHKRTDVLNYLRKKNFSIICLQDTHINNKMKDIFRAEWGYEALICPYQSNSRGVAILFRDNFEYKVNKYKIDKRGNYIIANVSIEDKTLY